jgi:hypothetical protein
MLKSHLLAATALAVIAELFPIVAVAQTSPDAEQSIAVSDATDSGGEIIVTGSRIRRPNLDSSVPITSISPKDLIERGDLSLGDALNQLPALRTTFSQANSTAFIGTAGLNQLDLRGQGTSRGSVHRRCQHDPERSD